MGRFLSPYDMAEARLSEEIFNSRLKRGEIKDPDKIRKQFHVVCGCGAPGCIFIACTREEQEKK